MMCNSWYNRGESPTITLHLEVPLVSEPSQLHVEFNEVTLPLQSSDKGWLDYDVPTQALRTRRECAVSHTLEDFQPQ